LLEGPGICHVLADRIFGRKRSPCVVDREVDRRDRPLRRTIEHTVELDLGLTHERPRIDDRALVLRECHLPAIELACVGDTDLEANAGQLQVLASQLDVLALDSRLRFGSEHADVGHARAEHDVEHVGEVAILTPFLQELSAFETGPGLLGIEALARTRERGRLPFRDLSSGNEAIRVLVHDTGLKLALRKQRPAIDLHAFFTGVDELLGDQQIQVVLDRVLHREAHVDSVLLGGLFLVHHVCFEEHFEG